MQSVVLSLALKRPCLKATLLDWPYFVCDTIEVGKLVDFGYSLEIDHQKH